jgi:hypothetical protein
MWHARLARAILPALCAAMLALPTFAVEEPAPKPQLDSITVETARDRKALERQVNAFVRGISVAPREQSLANWQSQVPICPLVAGLSREDGEYMLARLSKIAASAGAPLAPEHCKPNFFVIVTSQADALVKAWSKRDTTMFGGSGGTAIHKFLNSTVPVRAWYNAELYNSDGTRVGSVSVDDLNTPRYTFVFNASRIDFNDVRNLESVIVVVDAVHAKGITFGQLAAYVAMVGLAEIRPDARASDAPASILQLFSNAGKPPPGLSAWDEAFLKALYHTEHLDQHQISAINTEMMQAIAPKH